MQENELENVNKCKIHKMAETLKKFIFKSLLKEPFQPITIKTLFYCLLESMETSFSSQTKETTFKH